MPSSSPFSPMELKYMMAHIRDDRQATIIAACVVCLTLACIAVILRFFARRLSNTRILWDDYMILVALLAVIGQTAGVLNTVRLGLGKHIILVKSIKDYARTIIAQEVLYCIGTSAFKFSALLLFRRIFGSVRHFDVVFWIITFVILANNIAEIFLSIFQCNPVHKAWDVEVPGSCVNILLAACIPGSINVITDLVVVLVPVPMIWNLHMDTIRKIQLVGIFLLSGFVCVASTYRTIVVKRLSHKDATWADVDPAIWAVVENAIGVISASLPTMRPLYVLFVRGHYCHSIDQKTCSKCSKGSSGSSAARGGSRTMSGVGAVGRVPRKPSYPDDVASVEKGRGQSGYEMV